MRKSPAHPRLKSPLIARGAKRVVKPSASTARDVGWAVVLSVLFWLIFYQNLPDHLGLWVGTGPYEEANTLDRTIKICMIVVSLYLIVARWSFARLLLKEINVGAAALLVLALLSAAWSIAPEATMLRCVSLLSFVLLSFTISLVGWHRRRLQQVVIPPLMFILVGSLVLSLFYPDKMTELGTDISQKDAWHGITLTKNQFGMAASVTAIICINSWLAREGRALWAIAGAAVAFTCLILSRSHTSLLATMVAVLSMVLVMRVPVIKQRFSTHVIVGFSTILLLYEAVIQNVIPGVNTLMAPVMALTGKDMTFSARTIIWQVIKDHIHGAPYLGTGYGAYWIQNPSSPSYIFVTFMYFYPTEAHNGYLEIVNDLGWLGLCCLLLFMIWYIRQALQLLRTDRSQAALYMALLFQEMVMDMSESEWFSRSSTFAVLFLGMFCMSRALLEAKRRGSA